MNNKTPLQPLDSISMTDRVENILREYFEDNGFKPGDSLPGEVEIAEKLEVSRNMVRPYILGGFERVLNPFILGDNTLRDVFEMRLILEMGMAEFLFARKTEKCVKELEGIVAEQKSIE